MWSSIGVEISGSGRIGESVTGSVHFHSSAPTRLDREQDPLNLAFFPFVFFLFSTTVDIKFDSTSR